MAAFTDQPMTFSPYISQQPVDDLIRVGMEKQRMYEEGVSRVQSYIDTVAGLEVIKGEHRDYLDTRVKQLSTEISKVLSEDFSNKHLLGQVGGLASTIIKDPIVQTAIVSTQKYKSELGRLQKAREEGKSSPSNEWLFQKNAQAWLTDGDAKSPFSAEYIPFVDVNKKVMEAIKMVDPNTKLTQLPFMRDENGEIAKGPDGNPVINVGMLEMMYESKTVDQIRNAVQGALNEADLQQLQIDGMYHYRGETPQTLKATLDRNYQSRLTELNKRRQLIGVRRAEAVGNEEAIKALNDELASVENEADSLVTDYERDFQDLNANPEGFKSKFFLTNYINTLTSAYSTVKETYKWTDNPFQKQLNEDRDYELKRAEMLFDIQYKMASLEAARAKKEDETLPTFQGQIPGGASPDVPKPTEAAFLEEIDKEDSDIRALEQMGAATIGDTTGQMTPEQKLAAFKGLYDAWQETGINQGDPTLTSYFKRIAPMKQVLENKKALIGQVINEANKQFSAGRGNDLRLGTGTDNYFLPEEINKFNEKFNPLREEALKKSAPAGPVAIPARVPIDDKKAQTLFTPKELKLYRIAKKQFEDENGDDALSPGEKVAMKAIRLNAQARTGRGANAENYAQRQGFISERLGGRIPSAQTRYGSFDVSKEEKRKAVIAGIIPFLSRAKDEGGGVEGGKDFDLETAQKLIEDKETQFSYQATSTDAKIIMSHSKHGTQEFKVPRSEFTGIMGSTLWAPTQWIEDQIFMSGDRGTTNVIGKGATTALLGKTYFPNVKDVGVKADLRKTLDGEYVIDLHVYDKIARAWKTIPHSTPAVSIQAALDAMQVLTDDKLTSLLR